MKKQFMKIIAPLLALLIVASLGVFPASVTAQTSTAQEKTMYFMENLLPIDLSQYTITLQHESTMAGIPIGDINRNITTVEYQLTSEESNLTISFLVEHDTVYSCNVYTIEGEVIPSEQYSSLLDAVVGFLEKYQTYTQIDSRNLVAMLDGVDLTKNYTVTTENTKLAIKQIYFGMDQTGFIWTYTVDGVDYTKLSLTFDAEGNFMSVVDTRVLYTIVDTSINVSQDQAIELALENLQSYSYEMSDGSIVEDFNISDVAAMLYTIPVDYVDYELRPYWDIRLYLDDVYPGNVFGVTVFLWADTGEIISVSNMASGGSSSSGDSTTETVPSSTDTTSGDSNLASNLLVPLGIAAILAVIAVSAVVAVKRRKQQPL
jgi:hypothetical protein